ncbi:MAG: shikimate kinase [Candidatus Peregrinibacteria bacterium]|nr:shikimate kinase [Candidatus Peregrinibacteria bacterium]
MNIVFTGMRGTGKSSLGKELSRRIKWDFIDIDKEIERILNKKVVQYVEEAGWEAFRKMEQEVAIEAANRTKTVISTGGGTMMDPESARALKASGHVVLLICDMEKLKEYLLASYERPSLGGEKSAIEELEEVWGQRKDQYHAIADTIHETNRWPNVKELLEKLKSIPDLDL